MKIAIYHGRVICPANQTDKITDVYIENGQIVSLAPVDHFKPDLCIDATNLWVIPGLVDICCRPQMKDLQGVNLQLEAQASLKRGITSLCIPPDTDPINDTTANVMRFTQQRNPELPSFYPIGALTQGLTGEFIADLTALKNAGCIAFSQAAIPIKDLGLLRHCYDFASSYHLPIVIQPLEPSLAKKGVAHEGSIASRLGLPGIPETAETIAIAQHLLLIEQCEIRAHFTCLSSQRSVKLIQEAKARGLPVSADCAMHMLHLTENNLIGFDANCHLYPPVRSVNDRAGLIKGLTEGTLDAICSDHRPLDTIAKLAPFGDTIPGLSSIDSLLSLGLHLVQNNQLNLLDLINALTFKPAQIFQLPAGTLSIGARADVCIIDPTRMWSVSDETLLSQGKNTPFKQWELPGVVTHTILNGKMVYEHENRQHHSS